MRRLLIVVLLALAAPSAAQELEVRGYVAGELRGFFESPQFPGQLDHWQPSVLVEPELRLRTDDGRHEIMVTPFARLDGVDDDRSHVDLREAYWRGVFGDWELLVGWNTVFWGVTESRHLVDPINQIDFREDVDEEDKLGQPMLNLEWQRSWGRLAGFVLLGFRERPFPGREGRLRFPLGIRDEARYPDGRRDVDVAARYSHFLGDIDIGVHLFHGTGRESSFEVSRDGRALVPVYRTITQAGLDLQYTRDAWLWKLEALARWGHGDAFAAMVGGVEYTRYQIFDSAADLGLLAEYLHDGRDATAPPTAFDNDGFFGTRLALNDTQDTVLLAGFVVDLEDGTLAARVEAERRLTDRLTLDVESRLFGNAAPGTLLEVFSHDSFLMTRLNVYF